MNFTVSPSFTQAFDLAEGTEGCGCCGFFCFRPKELVLDEKEQKLVRVWRASASQRERVTQWLMKLGQEELRKEKLPEGTDPEVELRVRAGSLLDAHTRVTEEGLDRFTEAVLDAVRELRSAPEVIEEEMH